MNKTIVLTFDDGRKDQYLNAVNIMRKYNLTGTIYITTGFVDGTIDKKNLFPSSGGEAMSVTDIRDSIKLGFEIGIHSDKHTNEVNDIRESLRKLREWTKELQGMDFKFGFASPSSNIYKKNINKIDDIVNEITYVRTSGQVRRNGLIYTMLFLLNRVLKSKMLYYLLNKRYIGTIEKNKVIESVPIRSYTPLNHIIYFIDKIPDSQPGVLLFHSILTKEEGNKKVDCWYYDSDKFEKLCQYLVLKKYKVTTMMDVIKNENF